MFVRDLMSTDVVTVHRGGSLRDAAGRLLAEDVGSVVVVNDEGNPVGILTESDCIRAAYESGRTLDDIPISALSHRPVVTTKPDSTVPFVASKMRQEGVKKVPVMDDLDLVGIVTLSDIVWHLSDLRQEAASRDKSRSEWSPEG